MKRTAPLLRRSELKSKRRKSDVPDWLFGYLLARDKECVPHKRLGAPGECVGRLTIEHVRDRGQARHRQASAERQVAHAAGVSGRERGLVPDERGEGVGAGLPGAGRDASGGRGGMKRPTYPRREVTDGRLVGGSVPDQRRNAWSIDHCRKCGADMVFRAKPSGEHDAFTGAPTQHEYRVCPNWKPGVLWFDNGHDWWHRGVNPIDGVMPHGADPMKMENPPSPRGAA